VSDKIKIPRTKIEADQLIGKIGKLQARGTTISRIAATRLAEIEKETKERTSKIAGEIGTCLVALFGFFSEHQKELTENGKINRVFWPSGETEIFSTVPKVTVSAKQEERVISLLKASGLDRFVRIREEVIKDAIGIEPEAVAGIEGIKVTRTEKFLVRPRATSEAITESTRKLRKLLK